MGMFRTDLWYTHTINSLLHAVGRGFVSHPASRPNDSTYTHTHVTTNYYNQGLLLVARWAQEQTGNDANENHCQQPFWGVHSPFSPASFIAGPISH